MLNTTNNIEISLEKVSLIMEKVKKEGWCTLDVEGNILEYPKGYQTYANDPSTKDIKADASLEECKTFLQDAVTVALGAYAVLRMFGMPDDIILMNLTICKNEGGYGIQPTFYETTLDDEDDIDYDYYDWTKKGMVKSTKSSLS